MRDLILLLGTNLGDREQNLDIAVKKLSEVYGNYTHISAIYETEPWGYEDEQLYYNRAIVFKTDLLPYDILHICKAIELVMGRRKQNLHKYENRIIDIDIIALGEIVINEDILSIPHTKVQDRRFVLEPLNEIVPDMVHPVLKKTYSELLSECKDKLKVIKVSDFPENNIFVNHKKIPYNYLAIEGCIGAGKTSLSKMIARDVNAKLILEEFEDNDFLPKFYKDPEKYAFPLELSFLSSRYNQLNRQLVGFDLFHTGIVADYFMAKSYVFACQTLNDDVIGLYSDFFNFLNSRISQPDLILYLYMDIDRLLYQIKKRGRVYEQDISADYLNSIQKGYLNYFAHKEEGKFLIVDIGDADFVNNDSDYQKIFNLLKQQWNNKINKVFL